MYTISGLYIYPIKSLGGISINEATLTDRGFEYDRRWMLIDKENRFLSQRELPVMALLQVSIKEEGLLVHHKNDNSINPLLIPFKPATAETLTVNIWDDVCVGEVVSNEADEWFSAALQMDCRLVYMPDDTQRLVDLNYARQEEVTSFSDGFPILMIGEASLEDLNEKLASPVPMNRFRPNIVFTGGEPFDEDKMKHFTVNAIDFFAVKPCARCVMTTIEQTTAERNKEPLATLSTYRRINNKVMFGQNILFKGSGKVTVGDSIDIQQ